ncbi:ABC transporter permease [Intestinibacillus massiliensis]|uniref:ABC transporter permease n=1 Tax=Intestinibacillus massiliensis TaxID=1871029 RepID=UPI000B356277|nr:ABC transporter permease [Intestinibacillus massiliensis]MCB6366777.1 ABC transporter permease [Intestinibacillus massiliensis]
MKSNTNTLSPKKVSMKDFGLILVFIALVVILAIVSGGTFVTPRNLLNVVKQTAINGILAMGMTFVIISGDIDLSVGSTVALTGVIATMFAHPAADGAANGQYPFIVPILLALLVGALVGALNGVGIAYGSIPAFIVTLGSMTIVRGLALIISGGSPIFDVTPAFESIASIQVGGVVPILAVYLIIIVAICAFILGKTVFGRRIYAIGGNATAASVSGINVRKLRVIVFTIAGLLAGLCGLLVASRTITGSPTAGQSYEMDAIAAAVIGGVSMSGGSGKWYGVVIGALMLAVISNGLDIMSVNSNFQLIIKGLIIIFAVLLDIKGKGKRS